MSDFVSADILSHEKEFGLCREDYNGFNGKTRLERLHNFLRVKRTTFCRLCKINLGRHIED